MADSANDPLCPVVEINYSFSDCINENSRELTVIATVTGDSSQSIDAALFIQEGKVFDAKAYGSVVLNWTGIFPTGSDVPFEVYFDIPSKCPSTFFTIHVPLCSACPQVTIHPPIIDDCTDGSHRNVGIHASITGTGFPISAGFVVQGGGKSDSWGR